MRIHLFTNITIDESEQSSSSSAFIKSVLLPTHYQLNTINSILLAIAYLLHNYTYLAILTYNVSSEFASMYIILQFVVCIAVYLTVKMELQSRDVKSRILADLKAELHNMSKQSVLPSPLAVVMSREQWESPNFARGDVELGNEEVVSWWGVSAPLGSQKPVNTGKDIMLVVFMVICSAQVYVFAIVGVWALHSVGVSAFGATLTTTLQTLSFCVLYLLVRVVMKGWAVFRAMGYEELRERPSRAHYAFSNKRMWCYKRDMCYEVACDSIKKWVHEKNRDIARIESVPSLEDGAWNVVLSISSGDGVMAYICLLHGLQTHVEASNTSRILAKVLL